MQFAALEDIISTACSVTSNIPIFNKVQVWKKAKESGFRKCIFAESADNSLLVWSSDSSLFTRKAGFKYSYLSAMLSVSTLSYYLMHL